MGKKIEIPECCDVTEIVPETDPDLNAEASARCSVFTALPASIFRLSPLCCATLDVLVEMAVLQVQKVQAVQVT